MRGYEDDTGPKINAALMVIRGNIKSRKLRAEVDRVVAALNAAYHSFRDPRSDLT